MKKLFSLGSLFVSDFLKEGESPRGGKHDLQLMLEEDTGAVRLESTVPLDTMFGKYFYRSGINASMRQELKNIVDSITGIYKLKENDIWIDIAANDGTLLSYLPKNIIRIGIDPADDTYKQESEKHANLIIQDYFTAKKYNESKFGNIKAKVITSIAMLYDIDKPDVFMKDIHEVLDDNGLWVAQMSYSPLMIQQLAFDNILSEHIYYYSLFNLKKILERNGFKILDCQLNDVNGGSFRLYIMKESGDLKRFGTQPYRDICNFRINSLLEYEKTLKLDSVETWMEFYDGINRLRDTTVNFIKEEKAKGKTIYGYGASTKGNTLLQYFNLDNNLITAIAERSTYKWGLTTVGTNIPIVSEEEMRKAKPDYLLVLPWHFISEFIDRENDLLKSGTKFIVPCPKFEIIGL